MSVVIPFEQLRPETLDAVIEEFVSPCSPRSVRYNAPAIVKPIWQFMMLATLAIAAVAQQTQPDSLAVIADAHGQPPAPRDAARERQKLN
jgi:hypothetical protein